jgi:transposase
VNAISTIMLLKAIEAMYPGKRLIHPFVDNACYHHARLVQAWLTRLGARIKLHFIPTYCPHLDPIERLWGLMHKHVTHNRSHATWSIRYFFWVGSCVSVGSQPWLPGT